MLGKKVRVQKGAEEMRKVYVSLLVLALIAMVACAKPPQQQIDAAKAAVAAAKAAQADVYAADS